MADYDFDDKLARSIVARTMQIIDCNVNVMDARGRIIGSGDKERVGEIHEGALLALTQERIVNIDDASVHMLQGVRPGVNLPLRLNGNIVGVIGLTGTPAGLRQYGELVCMTAEMMLEQARLLQLLAQNSRLREELVLSLVRSSAYSATQCEWAQRLGVDLQKPRIAMVVELDSGQLGVSTAMTELQQLQSLLMETDKDDLMAIVSLTEMVVLKPAFIHAERWEPEEHKRRMEKLYHRLQEGSSLRVRLALGNFFPGDGGVERSYHTAKTTMKAGKQRMPETPCYCYQDMELPVLLDSLRGGWQANELVRPLRRLKAMDSNGVFRKTLHTWFRHNLQAAVTANALYIHKNTLEYRLRRISELTGLNLANFDDRFLLYVAVQLDDD
ncbi:CdaR family transcriptional regulator [Pectobacterium parmentieri]|uniref:CdaR family transcriptional regulator n=1 Tax=Pectobacterium parmentieri TaxID=1905730 RepID=UPI000EB2B710|nr:CdaR family transcriptional regulator [Pectobacterium parmentieri]AYH02766.1 carbohydrate diacid regulon transcriptional regulator CdaR [Pectobacterium parmentieri]AYH29026.1 carbohydrate diacid regulon transcriptional regulator CdaR [Pectobacterium parmentieri]AYH33443.1 carbohydrate diacid regulon transcriptional regulator CdaR [Pectobacterium parmentieri]MBI0518665.1 CdaR family transcriptional regulator [Pectobacterium parmentieri]